MAYTPHVWVPRLGSNLNRFTKANETATSVDLINAPEIVTQAGTPFSTDIMNEMEEGITDANAGIGLLATCATAAATQIKEIDMSDYTIQAGMHIDIDFTYGNTVGSVEDGGIASGANIVTKGAGEQIRIVGKNGTFLFDEKIGGEYAGSGCHNAGDCQEFVITTMATGNTAATAGVIKNKDANDACKHQYGRLRKANLADIFGTTDVPTIIAYSKNQKDAVCIGDYVTLPAFSFVDDVTGSTVAITTTGNNSRIRVAGNPSPYCGSGDTVNADGILWEFQNCPFLRGMNATDTNSGSYVGSEAHNVLNGAFATALQSVVGSANAIQSTRRLLPTSNDEDYGDWGWYGEKCFLLTEAEVLGFKNVGAKKFQVGNMFQLPIYALDPSAKIKYYNGSRYWWWLATAYSIDSDNGWNSSLFAVVSYVGYADWSSASNGSGISPAFVIA